MVAGQIHECTDNEWSELHTTICHHHLLQLAARYHAGNAVTTYAFGSWAATLLGREAVLPFFLAAYYFCSFTFLLPFLEHPPSAAITMNREENSMVLDSWLAQSYAGSTRGMWIPRFPRQGHAMACIHPAEARAPLPAMPRPSGYRVAM